MRVVLKLHGVSALLKLVANEPVAVGIRVVVRSHVIQGEAQDHVLALARRKQAGLGIGHQHGRGLLDAAGRIRSRAVHLHDLLAGHAAGVGHAHRLGKGRVTIDALVLLEVLVHDLPRESGVRKPVSKRVLNNALVAGAMDVAHAIPKTLGVGRLVPAVTHIDALDVVDKAGRVVLLGDSNVGIVGTVCRVQTGAVGIDTLAHLAGVCPARGCAQVIGVRVGQAARRVDLAPQRVDHALRAVLTGGTHDHAGVDARDGLDLAQLHRVGRVDQHHDLVIVGAHVTQQGLFFAGKLQVGAGGVGLNRAVALRHLVLDLRAVVALAGDARNDDNRRVRELLGVVEKFRRVVVAVVDAGFVQAAELIRVRVERARGLAAQDVARLLAVRTLAAEAAVHVDKFIVVLVAAHVKRVEKIRVCAADLTRARAAHHPLGRRPAKDVNLGGIAGQRQHIVVVLRQHQALGLDLLAQVHANVQKGVLLVFCDIDLLAANKRFNGIAHDEKSHVDRHQCNNKQAKHHAARNSKNATGALIWSPIALFLAVGFYEVTQAHVTCSLCRTLP